MQGRFIDDDDGQTWYRIDGIDQAQAFFVALASDSDVWAFVSTAGSLAAGRRDAEGAFFPYETVDRIHQRWEHTGPRTWIRFGDGEGTVLWQPFAPRLEGGGGTRSVWKNLSGTRLRFREEHASGRLSFEHEWSSAAGLGLVRTARLRVASADVPVQVLDGVLNLVPPGVSVAHATTMSSLTDAYKWNEAAAGGRLGLYALYARIWDRAEPKESFEALVAWHAGVPASAQTLLSDHQLRNFCRGEPLEAETLTRGRKGAFLVHFQATVHAQGLEWHQVIDSPRSQVQVAELVRRLDADGGTPAEIRAAIAANTAGVDELLARADGLQQSGDPMAAAHHRSNVLFNIMRGGVFADGTRFHRDDLRAFVAQRHRPTAERLAATMDAWPPRIERAQALSDARRVAGAQGERVVLGYLPLTFSRRHGDPSRPWNKFSIRVRDNSGERVLKHEGNWRDIFQNWEALLASEPAYAASMIEAFLGAMTPDGYNPYRIGRSGIDWEVIEPENPWSNIGYWGDHPVIYLLRLLEAAQAREPELLSDLWDRALFSFADVPYRLKAHAEQTANPKSTIRFDDEAHARAHARAARIGADGLMLCDEDDHPVLATLAEKLAIIVLAKAGSLVPGGGLWLHTQRPEWNDANNALVGNGLSIVTLAHLRRLLGFIGALPAAQRAFSLSQATLAALTGLGELVRSTPASAADDPAARRAFVDRAGALLDVWRAQAYRGAAGRTPARAPAGLLAGLAQDLLPLTDATLERNHRGDGLFHGYNLVDFSKPGRAELSRLYLMLEVQVALLSCGWLTLPDAVRLLDALFASDLFDPRRRSFMLYPDRPLPGFLERNRLDDEALALPIVQTLLSADRTDLLQSQSDGVVRFAPALSNRGDLEAAGRDLGAEALAPLAAAYERLLQHHAFTGRSGTMFAYEGLGCIYWHMVAKLLLAVQERVFEASDAAAPELPALVAHYQRVRDGLGYRKSPAEWGAFPADPYSHTAAEGGAQQPGMTGQVKEEILTRWGELGLRFEAGLVRFDPVLLDRAEVPADGALCFTLARVPYRIRHGVRTRVRTLAAQGWVEHPQARFDPMGVEAVEIDVAPEVR
ncbi:hypothetical protein BurJ1DRAFT_0974 [Burkholderiales bacterium JOSHI_001]|nr:hypothetical protein BurJ1DRAFT_0974 [Burkholderiales bacterium JOSHI_001]